MDGRAAHLEDIAADLEAIVTDVYAARREHGDDQDGSLGRLELRLREALGDVRHLLHAPHSHTPHQSR